MTGADRKASMSINDTVSPLRSPCAHPKSSTTRPHVDPISATKATAPAAPTSDGRIGGIDARVGPCMAVARGAAAQRHEPGFSTSCENPLALIVRRRQFDGYDIMARWPFGQGEPGGIAPGYGLRGDVTAPPRTTPSPSSQAAWGPRPGRDHIPQGGGNPLGCAHGQCSTNS